MKVLNAAIVLSATFGFASVKAVPLEDAVTPVCKDNDFRCFGEIVQQCSFGQWITLVDCASQGLVCAPNDFECTPPITPTTCPTTTITKTTTDFETKTVTKTTTVTKKKCFKTKCFLVEDECDDHEWKGSKWGNDHDWKEEKEHFPLPASNSSTYVN